MNRYINANGGAAQFAERVLQDKSIQEPAWVGFVENPESIKAVTGDIDTSGYLVLIPADAVHHIDKHHKHDGKGQRPAKADDYNLVSRVLAEGTLLPSSPSNVTGLTRFIAELMVGSEVFRCIFEVTGKKLRSVSLVTMSIKTK